jgi:hypothetical protein
MNQVIEHLPTSVQTPVLPQNKAFIVFKKDKTNKQKTPK